MSFDSDSQEARRNTTIAIGVAVAAVTMVALLYWLFSSLTGPALAVAPAAITTTATPSGTPVAAESATAASPPPTMTMRFAACAWSVPACSKSCEPRWRAGGSTMRRGTRPAHERCWAVP